MTYEFRFPDVGEGITEGELVKWLVKEGDKVHENDNIAQIETDKAVVDIPSPKTGKILKLHFKDGDVIHVGDVLVTIDDDTISKTSLKKLFTENEKSEQQKVEKRKSVSVVGELEEAEDEDTQKPKVCIPGQPCDDEENYQQERDQSKVLAVPRIRALAQKLGVDITTVIGTGENGRIIDDDIIAASQKNGAVAEREGKSTIKVAKKYDMFGYVDRIQLKGVRKTIARNMMTSFHYSAPVTAMTDIDVTNLWNLREIEKKKAEKQGVSLTFFPYIIRAVIEGLKKHPYLNSEINGDEIILKKYYNIGIAVDTEVGLIVPVIKRAEIKSLYDLAKEILELADKARKRTLDIMDLKGGSFTITNYGSIGTNYGTPIINPPEAAILGLGKIFDRAVLQGVKLENRKILPLSLTFDHRILDGAEAARFLNDVMDYLEHPEKIRFEGEK